MSDKESRKEITERQKVDDELKPLFNKIHALSSEVQRYAEEMNAIFTSMTDPLLIYDTQGSVVRANKAASDSLGIDPIGLNMDNLIQLFSTRTINGKKVNKKEVISGRALRGETLKDQRYLLKDIKGEDRVLISSSAPILIEGRISGAVTTWRDITEQERMEKALESARSELELQVIQRTAELVKANKELNKEIKEHREVSEILEKVFSSIHVLIAYLDIDFNFIRVNQAYAKADNHAPDFYIGKNHFHLYPNEENEAIFRKVVETGEAYVTYAKPFVYPMHPERGITYWDWSLQPIKDPSGEVEALVICLVDVTKRKRAEEKLMKAQKELNDAKRLSDIGTLAATVAHELRNPLAVIETAAYNISKKRKNLELDKHLANIELSILESEAIINNLLFYSRIKMPDYKVMGIYEVLDEVIESVKNRLRRKKIFIERDYRLPKNVLIEADPHQIKEVFVNILNNAYDALKGDGGRIEIGVESGGNDVIRLYFKDYGCGIDEEDVEKVKEPFFSKKSQGTGLGLSVCNQIVSLHGGTIEIESKKDHGTKVTVNLPIRRKSNDQQDSYH